MLLNQLKEDLVASQKSGDKRKVETLRFLLGEIQKLEIAKYPPSVGGSLTDEDVRSVIAKQLKAHRESIESFEKGGRADLVAKEQEELVIIQSYLPKQLNEDEITEGLKAILEANPGADFGTLMKLSMEKFNGKADGGVVAQLLRKLNG